MNDHKQVEINKNLKPESDFLSTETMARTDKDLNIKNFFIFDDFEFSNFKGERLNLKVINEDYYIQPNDLIVGVISTTAVRTVYLPKISMVGFGKHYTIADIGGSATSNLITINGNGSTINGETTKGISTNYKSFDVVSTDTGWYNLNT